MEISPKRYQTLRVWVIRFLTLENLTEFIDCKDFQVTYILKLMDLSKIILQILSNVIRTFAVFHELLSLLYRHIQESYQKNRLPFYGLTGICLRLRTRR